MATEDINNFIDDKDMYGNESGSCYSDCCDPVLRYAKIPVFVTAVALILAEGRTVDEISLLAAVLTQLGDTLDTIATQKEISGIKSCEN